MLTLLAVVLPRVGPHVLRSKFHAAAGLLGGLLVAHTADTPIAKAALSCLAQVELELG